MCQATQYMVTGEEDDGGGENHRPIEEAVAADVARKLPPPDLHPGRIQKEEESQEGDRALLGQEGQGEEERHPENPESPHSLSGLQMPDARHQDKARGEHLRQPHHVRHRFHVHGVYSEHEPTEEGRRQWDEVRQKDHHQAGHHGVGQDVHRME